MTAAIRTHENQAGAGSQKYVPAMGHAGLERLYDPLVRLTLRERLFKGRLVDQMRIQPEQRVLDIGCGTGTLALMIKQRNPQAHVFGIDGDASVLAIARRKFAQAGLDITLEQAMSFALPFEPDSFDRVASSLMLHHLTRENKLRTLREAARILKPGAELHVADFGKPANGFLRAISLPALLGEPSMVRDNLQGLLPELIAAAGFMDVHETARFNTLFGSISLFQATKSGEMQAAGAEGELR
jgi:SAM-dependent methyltransferase